MPATRGLKKDSERAITLVVEAVRVPAHLVPPGSPLPKQLRHLHAQLSLGQSCRRQKSLASVHAGLLWSCPTLQPCRLWPARLLYQGRGISRQEYWSVLANTGCHTLLDYYISCCPSHQPPLSTWCCQGPRKPSSCATFMLNSHWDRLPQAKEVLCLRTQGPFGSV